MFVTVLFSPSLCTKFASSTQRVVSDDDTVRSFVAGLHQDFKFHKCIEELELHLFPASYLWMGTAGINNKLWDRSCPLAGNDRLWTLVSKSLGNVLFLTERREELGDESKVGLTVNGDKDREGEREENGRESERGDGFVEDSNGADQLVKELVEPDNASYVMKELEGRRDGSTFEMGILFSVNGSHQDAAAAPVSQAVLDHRGKSVREEQELLQESGKEVGIFVPPEDTRHTPLDESKVVDPMTGHVSGLTAQKGMCLSEYFVREGLSEVWVSDTDSESDSNFRKSSECLPGLKKFSHMPHPWLQPPAKIRTKSALISPLVESDKSKQPDVKILSSSEEIEWMLAEEKRVSREKKRDVDKMAEEDSAFNSTMDSIVLIDSPPTPDPTIPPPLSVSYSSAEAAHMVSGGLSDDLLRVGKQAVEVREGEEGSVDEGIGMDVVVESDSGDGGGSVIVIGSENDDDRGLLQGHEEGNSPFLSMEQNRVVRCCGINLSSSDLDTLLPNGWLNDQVVNCYMQLLMQQKQSSGVVFIASTFFYTKVCRSGLKGMRRWMKNVDFSKLSLFIVPVHLGVHWCLVAVHVKRKIIEYYDSLGGRNPLCMKRILQFVLHRKQKPRRVNRRRSPPSSHWRKYYPKDIPRQFGGVDCGVFVCQFARWLCNNYERTHSSIPFTQSHMHRLRHVMKQELENGKLMQLDF